MALVAYRPLRGPPTSTSNLPVTSQSAAVAERPTTFVEYRAGFVALALRDSLY
jgi:hypothetical protein